MTSIEPPSGNPILAASTPSPSPTDNLRVADELEKLAALRDKGILDDEEFNAHKRKLLGL